MRFEKSSERLHDSGTANENPFVNEQVHFFINLEMYSQLKLHALTAFVNSEKGRSCVVTNFTFSKREKITTT